ncbi:MULTISPECIES: ABC-ATPase domain-containing protein [Pseudonocardia]|uniref:ATPase n=2 Tax=Pseudonocardia TaxID=1847 RepID=A0ABQ0RRU4_9PSEU|nr:MULTISPECIES: ABC-ATPase domain-containing protein [Pseudonocardia]OSY43088.1 putative ATPase of the ABC class [Pseudonocardia autotrophica]TDN71576.1 putative ABC-class ATPase [Pseudonocardia autotrophica]BBG02265.1 ATPase [Pseudonocardia autotrophica]GEC23399.1 ATPase [Pseudonocardia saturnea]
MTRTHRTRPDRRAGGPPPSGVQGDRRELAARLHGMDGSGYGAYKGLAGRWSIDGAELEIRKVQADPFAPPSRLRVTVPAATAALPAELYRTPVRARALGGFLLRALRTGLRDTPLTVDAGGQEVLDRSAIRIDADSGDVVVELGVPLPGHGRRIAGHAAARTLTDDLPDAIGSALTWENADRDRAVEFVETIEDAGALRDALRAEGLVGFVADGAVLPRASGIDDRPLPDAVPFGSPESLRVTLRTPNRGPVTGMGVPEGVTLIVGGGYHGKSTLLRALETGVYDHVPGDGRELVVTRRDTVSVRAEDERSVQRVDVRAFVSDLPSGRPTDDFSTPSASGSTSQAASTIEALESGADTLLVDEDTSATNVMIRDARMRELISAEPLVPFVDRVRPLHRDRGVSTVLVMGGSGDYLDRADTVILLQDYRVDEITDRAREIAGVAPDSADAGFPAFGHRIFDPASVDPQVRGRRKVTARGRGRLTFGGDDIDLSAVSQLADPSQTNGIGLALAHLELDGGTLAEALDRFDADVERDGAAAIAHGSLADFAVPRRHEVAAALNRLRTARVTGHRRTDAPR